MSENKDIWKTVKGYPNYLISNTGKVRVKEKIYKNGTLAKGRILNQYDDSDKYLMVMLYTNNKRKNYRIHRLVAEHFIKNIENKLEVNHIDGIKHNNHVDNLEWCSHSENIQHAYNIGLFNK